MNRNERDERVVAAVEATAGVLLDASEAQERRVRLEEARASGPAPQRMFAGKRGAAALLRGIPGFAGLWEKVVPAMFVLEVLDRGRVLWLVVLCPCGSQTPVAEAAFEECAGACGRWFFATGQSVRVRRFPPAPADDLAA